MPSTIGILGGLIACSIAYRFYSEWNERKEFYKQPKSDDNMRPTINNRETCQLILKSLRDMGCQPQVSDDGNKIGVWYQGEYFDLFPGCGIVKIFNPYWNRLEGDNPNMPYIYKVINYTNATFGPTILFTDSDENNERYLHLLKAIMFDASCPDNTNYLKATLISFFDKKQELEHNYKMVIAEHSEQQQERRRRNPIGFAPQRASQEQSASDTQSSQPEPSTESTQSEDNPFPLPEQPDCE